MRTLNEMIDEQVAAIYASNVDSPATRALEGHIRTAIQLAFMEGMQRGEDVVRESVIKRLFGTDWE